MAPDSGNAAKQLPENETPEEPSMEEILSSIKQIIADDQKDAPTASAREDFTYPDNPSNSNATALSVEESELQASIEADLKEDVIEAASQNPVENTVAPEETIKTKAAAVRDQVSATGAGMTAEERIRQYRERNKLRIEALADEKAGKPTTPVTPVLETKMAEPVVPPVTPVAPPVAAPVAPSVARAPTPQAAPVAKQATEEEIAKEMASILMNERSGEIELMLKDLMRPTIRQWLNDNLPSMVQRLVREEIQAASRGRKSS